MSQLPLQPPPPSWLPTIFVGALAVVAVQLLLAAFGVVASAVAPAGPVPGVVAQCSLLCCCALQPLPIGAFIGFMAWRRDPALTPGQGFAVSFIAAGVGTLIMAVPQVLSASSVDDRERQIREVLQQMNETATTKMSPEAIQEVASGAAELTPYIPVVSALVVTVFAGICGLFTVGYLRSRGAPPVVPTPPSAHP